MYTTRPLADQRRPPQHGPVAQRLPDATHWDTVSEFLSSANVLPEQFFPFQTNRCTKRPEVALMRAVLADALACFQQGFVSRRRRVQRLAREAEAWFLSDDDHWPCSFVSICAVLGLEPAYIRRRLRHWSHGGAKPARSGPPRIRVAQRRLAA